MKKLMTFILSVLLVLSMMAPLTLAAAEAEEPELIAPEWWGAQTKTYTDEESEVDYFAVRLISTMVSTAGNQLRYDVVAKYTEDGTEKTNALKLTTSTVFTSIYSNFGTELVSVNDSPFKVGDTAPVALFVADVVDVPKSLLANDVTFYVSASVVDATGAIADTALVGAFACGEKNGEITLSKLDNSAIYSQNFEMEDMEITDSASVQTMVGLMGSRNADKLDLKIGAAGNDKYLSCGVTSDKPVGMTLVSEDALPASFTKYEITMAVTMENVGVFNFLFNSATEVKDWTSSSHWYSSNAAWDCVAIRNLNANGTAFETGSNKLGVQYYNMAGNNNGSIIDVSSTAQFNEEFTVKLIVEKKDETSCTVNLYLKGAEDADFTQYITNQTTNHPLQNGVCLWLQNHTTPIKIDDLSVKFYNEPTELTEFAISKNFDAHPVSATLTDVLNATNMGWVRNQSNLNPSVSNGKLICGLHTVSAVSGLELVANGTTTDYNLYTVSMDITAAHLGIFGVFFNNDTDTADWRTGNTWKGNSNLIQIRQSTSMSDNALNTSDTNIQFDGSNLGLQTMKMSGTSNSGKEGVLLKDAVDSNSFTLSFVVDNRDENNVVLRVYINGILVQTRTGMTYGTEGAICLWIQNSTTPVQVDNIVVSAGVAVK